MPLLQLSQVAVTAEQHSFLPIEVVGDREV